MSNFIDINDYDASIHSEILDALTRKDPAIVEICEERAIAEMRSSLKERYDVDAIFSARGEERNQLIVMFALDIAIYHIFCIHNPQKLSQIRKDRYERAIEWLKAVAKRTISIDGVPSLKSNDSESISKSPYLMTSNTKKSHHY